MDVSRGARERLHDEVAERMGYADRIRSLEAEAARLRKGIQDFVDGNYVHPRSFRPMPCPHGQEYYQECGQCNDDHFANLLAIDLTKPVEA